jgi:hypothetical protein
MALICGHLTQQCVGGLAVEIAMRPYRSCVPPVDQLFREGQLLLWGIPATGVRAETLLDRGAESDVADAEAAITWLAAARTDDGLVVREVTLPRLRALLARARGDADAYCDYRDRYRAMATELGFEGHMAMAEAMP